MLSKAWHCSYSSHWPSTIKEAAIHGLSKIRRLSLSSRKQNQRIPMWILSPSQLPASRLRLRYFHEISRRDSQAQEQKQKRKFMLQLLRPMYKVRNIFQRNQQRRIPIIERSCEFVKSLFLSSCSPTPSGNATP